eukprot:scaffold118639_cov33-Attheya_sp.AAC.2
MLTSERQDAILPFRWDKTKRHCAAYSKDALFKNLHDGAGCESAIVHGESDASLGSVTANSQTAALRCWGRGFSIDAGRNSEPYPSCDLLSDSRALRSKSCCWRTFQF